jgi:hypothetical protein
MKQRKMLIVLLSLTVLAGALFTWGFSSPATSARGLKIRRTILLKFKPEASPAQINRVLKAVKENISGIRGVRNVFVGSQISDRTPFTHGISMDFDDEAALKRYRADEGHRDTHNAYVHLIEQAQISDIRDE